MDRRAFVTLIAATCLLEPPAVRAQQSGRVFRIGLLVPRTEPELADQIALESLRTGLRDLGWVEGKNLVIETRWPGVNPQRQRELAAELKVLPVALILALARLPSARRARVLPVSPSSWSTPETRWARSSWPACPNRAAT